MTSRETVRPALLGFAALVGLVALGAGVAVAGWMRHGESLFLTLASDAWTLCF